MKRLIQTLCLLLIVTVFLCGCSLWENKYIERFGDAWQAVKDPTGERTLTHDGATITLPNTFLDYSGTNEGQGYPFFFASETIGLFGDKESKSELIAQIGECDLAQYAALIAELNEMEYVGQKDGFWTAIYETDASGDMLTFTVVFYETETDFWMVQAYCASHIYAQNEAMIWKYLTAVSFDGN